MGDPASAPPAARLRFVRRTGLVSALALVLAACSGGGGGDEAAFCQQIRTDLDALNGKVVTGAADERKAVAAAYERVARVAPGEIADEWGDITKLMRKVAVLDMTSESAYGDAFAAALDNEIRDSAVRVILYVSSRCGVDLNQASASVDQPPVTAPPDG